MNEEMMVSLKELVSGKGFLKWVVKIFHNHVFFLHFSLAKWKGDSKDPWSLPWLSPKFPMFHPQLATAARWLKQDLLMRNSTPKLYLPFEPLAIWALPSGQVSLSWCGPPLHVHARAPIAVCVGRKTQMPSPLEDGGDRGGAVVAIQFPTTMR